MIDSKYLKAQTNRKIADTLYNIEIGHSNSLYDLESVYTDVVLEFEKIILEQEEKIKKLEYNKKFNIEEE